MIILMKMTDLNIILVYYPIKKWKNAKTRKMLNEKAKQEWEYNPLYKGSL